MNPSKDPPPKVFIDVLKEWITTQSLTKTMVNTLILENYYKCYEIIDIFNLKEVFNNDIDCKVFATRCYWYHCSIINNQIQ